MCLYILQFYLPSCRMPFGASRHVVSLIRSPIMPDAVWCIPTRGITYSVSHHAGCRLVHPDTWYQLNAIRHHDGCRLVHPAKWDIGKFHGALVTNAVWCIPSGVSFDTSFSLQFRRIPFDESRLFHHSFFIRFSIIIFHIPFSYYLFKDILSLRNYITYSFMYSIHVLIHN